jgi:hypothetical protein
MHPVRTVELALLLSDLDVLDRENAEILGVSAWTVRHWRNGRRRNGQRRVWNERPCPRCDDTQLNRAAYAYLLGLYLGDGHVLRHPRSWSLTVSCSSDWPGLMDAADQAMRQVLPGAAVARRTRAGCVDLKCYWKHWPCLFPQHGPGKKHERAIVLEPWQREIVDEHGREFVRGLIHSDGCRFTNPVRRRLGSGDRWYFYPRYMFTNESADIRHLFTDALDRLGIAWRYSRRNTVSVARREAVAALDAFVGPKR